MWLFNRNHKKRGLILCGPSDKGKSFLGNILYGNYKQHETGYFNCPTGPQPSSLMLQQLTNCLAYTCDEMMFENNAQYFLWARYLKTMHSTFNVIKPSL